MKLLKMWTNGSPIEQPENTYRHALNAIKDIQGTALVNEYGAEVEHIFERQHICGKIVTAKNEVLYFLYNYDSADNEFILKTEKNEYKSLLVGQLNIKPEHIVTGDYIYNINGDLIFWFIDDINDIKLLNTNNIPLDLEKLNIFTSYRGHKFNFSEGSGGNLKCGAYFFALNYYDRKDNTSTYVPIISNPVYISNSVVKDATYSGGYINDVSNKSIQIHLIDLDSSFSSLELFVIKKISGELFYESIGIFDYSGTSVNISYNGQLNRLAAKEEIINAGVYYYGAQTIKTIEEENTNSTDVLVGNVKTKNINYQRYANGINLKCITQKISNILNHNESSKHFDYNVNNKSFCHFETYSFYIILHTIYGRSSAFHIPNNNIESVDVSHPQLSSRVNNADYRCTFKPSGGDTILGGIITELDISVLGTSQSLESIESNPDAKWFQYLDTLVASDFNSIGTDTYESSFNYWENENETYPDTDDFDIWTVISGNPVNTGLSLRGQKVKHYKFPSLKLCKEVHNDNQYGVTNFDILGIKVDTSTVVIPPELKGIVTGYEIAYAKRDSSNISVLSNTLTFIGSYLNSIPISQVHTFTGGNWGTTSGLGGDLFTNENYIKFSALDMLRRNINISPSFIRNEYLLQRQSNVTFTGTNGTNFTVGGHATIDYTANTNSEDTVETAEIRTPIKYNFMPLNSINSDVYGVFLNEHYAIDVDNFGERPLADAQGKTIPNFNLSASSGAALNASYVFGFLSSIISLKKEVYNRFYNQVLISTGQVHSLSIVDPIIYNGDVFNTVASHKMYGRHDSGDTADAVQGFRINYQYLTQSVDNFAFRAKGLDEYTYFSPAQDLNLASLYRDREPNNYRYLEDYSSINEFNPIFPYNTFDNLIEHFPNRILKFNTLGREVKEGAYKNLLANNYYDMPSSKGAIIAITYYNNRVYIQMEKSRYVTVNSKVITFDDGDKAFLGSQLLFSSSPTEIGSDNFGLIGCQNRTGVITTAFGDLIIDQERKAIYLSSDTIQYLSLDLESDFRELLPFNSNAQNPLFEYGLGYSICNDFINKRIIITKKDYRFNQAFFNYDSSQHSNYNIGDNLLKDNVYYEVILTNIIPLFYNSFFIRSLGSGDSLYAVPISFSSSKFDNKSWTVSYYTKGELSGWTSYHSYTPDFLFNDRDNYYRIENNYINLDAYIFKHNIKEKRGIYDSTNSIKEFSVAISNNDTVGDKRFLSLLWDTEFYINNVESLNTFSSLFAFNQNKATNLIPIILFDDIQNYPNYNVRRIKRYFGFNNLKNGVMNIQLPFVSLLNEYNPILSNLGQLSVENSTPLTGRYLIVKLIYDNKFISGNQGELRVNDIIINSTPVLR